MAVNFLGLRSSIYPVSNLAEAKAWWTQALGVEPYFDEPFYVGFNLGGYELGLKPDMPGVQGELPITYWGVDEVATALDSLTADGARVIYGPQDVGMGIVVADLQSATGQVFGVIHNPHFIAGSA